MVITVNLALDVEIALIGADQFHKLSQIYFQFDNSIQINGRGTQTKSHMSVCINIEWFVCLTIKITVAQFDF